ncbi:cysteine hydrolase family protein [Aeromicrobium phragmitis]|nr:isochorismatase family cysteine hydrolase [Aeromicrobium phragmitis]
MREELQNPERESMDRDWLIRRLDPQRTAVLVVDVQNDFCAEGGWYDRIGYDVSAGQAAARQLETFLPQARRRGFQIIFVKCHYDRAYLPRVMVESYQHKGLPLDYCIEGTWGAEFYGVQPEEGDLVVTKHRYSAFVGTNMDLILRSNGMENVVVAGVATNICVDSTARDAYMRDYRVTVLDDCCGTYDRRLHEATMENIRRAFGVVVNSQDVIEVTAGSDGSAVTAD